MPLFSIAAASEPHAVLKLKAHRPQPPSRIYSSGFPSARGHPHHILSPSAWRFPLTLRGAFRCNADYISAAGCCISFFLDFCSLHTFIKKPVKGVCPTCFVRSPHLHDLLFVHADKFVAQSYHARRQVRRFEFTLCSPSLPFFYFLSQPRKLHARQIRERAPVPMFYFCFLFVVSITSSNDSAAEPCPRSTPRTKSDLPSIIIFCIVASAGTSLSALYVPSDLTLPFPSLPPAPLREKTNKQITT